MAATYAPSLPLEIVLLIISFIPLRAEHQPTLHSATLVSRIWYTAALPSLYSHPHLTSGNFAPFTRTICPSINAHVRKTDLSDLIHVLDMSHLIHDSSRSLTARLLSRLRTHLQIFIAPSTTFSLNSFSALSKCTSLHTLDLSFVSEYVSIDRLFASTRNLPALTTLALSRSTVSDAGAARLRLDAAHSVAAPPHLRHLRISGTTSPAAADLLCAADLSLETLAFRNCRFDRSTAGQMLAGLSPALASLELGPRVSVEGGLDFYALLVSRPALRHLGISGLKLVGGFHRHLRALMDEGVVTGLQSLALGVMEGSIMETYEPAFEGDLPCADAGLLFDAVGGGALGALRKVKMCVPSGYFVNKGKELVTEMEELAEMLEVREKERAEESGEPRRETGVWWVDD